MAHTLFLAGEAIEALAILIFLIALVERARKGSN